ncbi:MAG: MFS transporter [Pseudomonadota bacterium]|nr:MFS transporter [Pseudomonadota bacterium]
MNGHVSDGTPSPAASGVPDRARMLPLLLINLTTMAGSYAFIALVGPVARLLHLQAWHVGFIIGVMGLVWMAAAGRWGRAADASGRVPVLRKAVAGFSMSYVLLVLYVWWALRQGPSALPAVGLSMAVLLATRAAMGGFLAGVPVAATAWMADHTPPPWRAAVMARFGAAGATGMVLAPPVAGWIGQYDIPSALLAFAFFPLLALPGLRRLTDDARLPSKAPGARLHAGDARIRLFWWIALALLSSVIIANICLGFYLIDHLRLAVPEAAAVAGYALGSAGAGLVFMQSIVGRLAHVSPLRWLRWGTLTGAAGFLSALVPDAAHPMWICLSYFVAGLGMAMAFPAVSALASNAVTASEQGACASAMSMAQGLAMVVAPLVGTALYDWRPTMPFVLIGLLLVLVFGASWARAPSPAYTTKQV